jgi:murein DD-endopeptidase MepM/ murein hydrolase activator NlpD
MAKGCCANIRLGSIRSTVLMNKLFAWGERLGGLVRAPRLYFAVVPLAVPLIFAHIETPRTTTSPERIATLAPLPPVVYDQPAPIEASLPEHSFLVKVRSGDTLDSIFQRGGFSRQDAYVLVQEFSKSVDPRRLRLGDVIRFHYAESGDVARVAMKVTGWGEVEATRSGEGFHVAAAQAPEIRQEIAVSANIESSLYEAIRGAGEQPQLVQSLVDVFQWDIDFFELQRGDAFSLVVEKKFSGSDPIGYGPILAARFVHDGELFEAFRFESPDGRAGYYTRNGTPVRKQFLRAPLKFSRITSGFTKRRFHPILKKMRPHYGVDYGAPTGTPVMSTADGVVVYAGYDGGEGNHVRIKHNARTETAYLHLSRFAKGLKKGTRVEQGDVIGYVGSTGLSTAPHLDYRVREGGKWINPLELKSIAPDPLGGTSLRQFRETVAQTSAKLDSGMARIAQAEKSRGLF